MLRVHWSLGLPAGVLITNPPPLDSALPRDGVEGMIAGALEACEEQGVRGKAVTPFLLSYLSSASGGKTLAVNVALLKNNAALAAEISVADAAVGSGGI